MHLHTHVVPVVLSVVTTGLIQPELLADGQVCVDMGEPILEGPKVPTTLAPTQVRRVQAGGLGG